MVLLDFIQMAFGVFLRVCLGTRVQKEFINVPIFAMHWRICLMVKLGHSYANFVLESMPEMWVRIPHPPQ